MYDTLCVFFFIFSPTLGLHWHYCPYCRVNTCIYYHTCIYTHTHTHMQRWCFYAADALSCSSDCQRGADHLIYTLMWRDELDLTKKKWTKRGRFRLSNSLCVFWWRFSYRALRKKTLKWECKHVFVLIKRRWNNLSATCCVPGLDLWKLLQAVVLWQGGKSIMYNRCVCGSVHSQKPVTSVHLLQLDDRQRSFFYLRNRSQGRSGLEVNVRILQPRR